MTDTAPRLVPRPRAMGLTFDPNIPRHWFGGHVLPTHVANGVNLLFPAGERFFVRSVRRYQDRIDDPVLREQVRGFAGQEGRHAQAHERFFEVLEGQGYRVRPFLRAYEFLGYRVIERLTPPLVRLAVTAACEHFTAMLAEGALSSGALDTAHPSVRALLLWHAAEEIEHKAVAFDVLQKVSGSYALRILGLFIAALCLGGFWIAATTMLLWLDRGLGARRLLAEMASVGRRTRARQFPLLRGIWHYLRRDFHPSQIDNLPLAAAYLASVGAG